MDLKDEFTLPLRKTECTVVESYNRSIVPAKDKESKPITFHALGDIDRKTQDDISNMTSGVVALKPKFSNKTTRMLIKVGLNPEKLDQMASFERVLTPYARPKGGSPGGKTHSGHEKWSWVCSSPSRRHGGCKYDNHTRRTSTK